MTTPTPRATPTEIRNYFGEDGAPKVTLQEMKDFKTADPKGYAEVAQGIADGTLTY